MPADKALPPGLPPGTICVVRSTSGSVTATTDLYTVPNGRRLHIVTAWCALSTGASAAAGVVEITVNRAGTAGAGIVNDLGNSRTLTAAPVAATAASSTQDNSNVTPATVDIPIVAGTVISLLLTGATGQIAGGFVGWEEAAPAGAGAE